MPKSDTREELPKLAALQRQRAKKRKGSLRYKRLSQQAARLHERVANLRREFVHQETTKLVRTCAVIATEELAPCSVNSSFRRG